MQNTSWTGLQIAEGSAQLALQAIAGKIDTSAEGTPNAPWNRPQAGGAVVLELMWGRKDGSDQ